MTAYAFEQQTSSTVVAQLADCTDDLATIVGGGCLVVDQDGRVVAQRLTGSSVPAAVLSCVLDGTVTALRAGVVKPRTTALLPSGPVIEGVLREGGERVAQLSLANGGAVWLLPKDAQPLELHRALPTLRRLDELLQCDGDTSEEVAPWLDGDAPTPSSFPPGPWRLARIESAGESPAALLRRAATGFGVVHRRAAYVVLTSRQSLEVTSARVVLSELTRDLAAARRQVDAALPLVPLNSSCTVSAVRAAVVVRHLGASLKTVPDLGSDPLDALLDHDAQRGTCFTEALAAWLDAGCDVLCAAENLGCHRNTLRYRLRRAFELLGTDLREDPDARLIVHLQLRTAGMPAA